MGGAVSSGESNDDLIDNLCDADYIKTPLVERVFRAVDRAHYYTEAHKSNAYKDIAWKDGNLHLSAPCIYSEVLENLALGPGMSFLNMGSGTGYLSAMCGLLIGKGGVNHGVELHPEVVDYAREKLVEFLQVSPAIDVFEFCAPEFVVGNCLNPVAVSNQQRYDRIYCGAACPEECVRNITDLLKVGGICVVPISDSLVQITRISESSEERKSLLPVSFASLITPRVGTEKKVVQLPDWKLPTLKELCRFEIRNILRNLILDSEVRTPKAGSAKGLKRRRRRQERRRASRLLVVQRRRSGAEDGETGFVAVAYSRGNNSSSDDDDIISREERTERSLRESDADEIEMRMQHDDDGSASSDLDEGLGQETTTGCASASEPMEIQIGSGASVSATCATTTNTSGSSDSGAFSQTTESNSNSASGSSHQSESAGAAGGNPGILHRARQARAQFSINTGTDGLLGRLRDIYRRREHSQSQNSQNQNLNRDRADRGMDLFRQVEQNLHDVTSRTGRIRQLVTSVAETSRSRFESQSQPQPVPVQDPAEAKAQPEPQPLNENKNSESQNHENQDKEKDQSGPGVAKAEDGLGIGEIDMLDRNQGQIEPIEGENENQDEHGHGLDDPVILEMSPVSRGGGIATVTVTASPPPSMNRNTIANNNSGNHVSCVWTDSSSSYTTISTTSDDNDNDNEAEAKTTKTATATGTATETGESGKSSASASAFRFSASTESESGVRVNDGNETKLKQNPVSVQMRGKLRELPLPQTVKFYLNYNRELD